MTITDFTHNHIIEALYLSQDNYKEEQRSVPILPSAYGPIYSLCRQWLRC